MATSAQRPLAIVTGASSGIGRELARKAARSGFDLIIAADQPLGEIVSELSEFGAHVQTVEADLATMRGVEQLCTAAAGRPIAALMANAGHGLGRGFLDQDFDEVTHVINTNITGTIYLIQKVGKQMCQQGAGRILITGSIAGYMPGTFQAVYNGTKAFIDSFALALRNEIKDTGVTVTCLMPGVTDTNFFERADMMDTQVGTQEDKDDPAEVAEVGFKAMMDGDADVVVGFSNKLQVAMAGITPAEVLAQRHRKMAEPGSARK
jgi:short-subunit dehydrogenase